MVAFVESLKLEPGEEVRAIYHRHGMTLMMRLTPFAVALIILFLFLFPLFSLGVRGVVVFAVILLFCITFSVRTIISWIGSVTILTNVRLLLVERFGFFKRRVSEMKLDQIFKVSYEVQGIRQSLGRYGTLILVVMYTGENMFINDIPNPQDALNEISLAVSAVKKMTSETPKQSEAHAAGRETNPQFRQHAAHDLANWR